MAEESRYLMEADAGGPVYLDPFEVAETRFRGTVPLNVLGAMQVTAPPLSSVLGVTPGPSGSIRNVGTGTIIGRGDPSNVTTVTDISSVTNPPRQAPERTRDEWLLMQINDRVKQLEQEEKRTATPQDVDAVIAKVLEIEKRDLELASGRASGTTPSQGNFPTIIPLPIDPALAAILTGAGILLGSGGGGGAPSGSTGGAGAGAGSGAGAGTGAGAGGSTSSGTGGTQPTTPPVGPESGDGRLILIGGQPDGPFVGPVAPPARTVGQPESGDGRLILIGGQPSGPFVGPVAPPVTPPPVTPPPPVVPPPVTPPPATPTPSPPRPPEGTTPTPPVAVVPVPVATPNTTPPSGGNISFTINPAVATPITVRTPDLNRDLLREGRISSPALKETAGSTISNYGALAGQPGQYDIEAFQNLIGLLGDITPQLTKIATEQTVEGNRAIREASLADVQRLSPAAMEAYRAANPELYSTLGTYLPAATGMLASDMARLQQGGRLTAEEVRSAQQSAREAGLARGREMDQSALAAEVLNRDAFSRAREAQARANVQQSMQNVYGGIGAAQAASFNPFATLLGGQYGMQTANVGTNQALFGQGTGFTSGQFSNPFVQGLLNPYSPYAADVYGSNFNAANARAITEAMTNAASQGANLDLIGNVAGQIFKYAIPAFGSIFTPSPTSTPPKA
jgi:hypothetical protein